MRRGQLRGGRDQFSGGAHLLGGFLGPVSSRGRVGLSYRRGGRGIRRGNDGIRPAGGGVSHWAFGERQRRFLPPHQTPLHDAGVLTPRGDEVAVVVEEADVGHMTAVGAVLAAGGLQTYR